MNFKEWPLFSYFLLVIKLYELNVFKLQNMFQAFLEAEALFMFVAV